MSRLALAAIRPPVVTSPWVRPFAANSPWNVPVAGLAQHPQSSTYVDRLWAGSPGTWSLALASWTQTVYNVTPGLQQHLVRAVHPDWCNMDGQYMPWNPAWQASPGDDAQTIILDPATGREWDIWQLAYNPVDGIIHCGTANLCPESYWTSYDGPGGGRGCGIANYAMMPMAGEMDVGEILHAIAMTVPNTDGSGYVAPAHKLEHPGNPPGVPEGMRFAVNLSDTNITNWLNAMPAGVTPATKTSAAKIARCLRDYGFFITDTGGTYGSGGEIDFEDYITGNPIWTNIGLGQYSTGGRLFPDSLLNGLVSKSQVRAIVPSDQY